MFINISAKLAILFEIRKNIRNFAHNFKEKNMKRYIFLFLIIFIAMAGMAQTDVPKYEVRAVWLTTIGGLDWPHSYANNTAAIERQKQELRTILDQLKHANVNTILLQTRVRATTIYPSSYEPWDGCLSGKPGTSPGYDALQFAIDECHKRGMELHAWVVTIPVGKWNALGCSQLRKKYPKLIMKIGKEGYMNPESAQTADYLATMCGEITRNYDIDGIHLDYIRYPETWKKKTNKTVGRSNITRIVKAINRTVKTIKPWVKMSCSPIGKYDDLTRYGSRGWNANSTVCQDAQGWLRDGLMDALFPMMYFRDNNFFPFAIDWAECSYGRIVAPGLGVYMLHPRELNWPLDVMTRELNVLRQFNLGHTYFRSKFFTDNVKGIYQYVANQFDRYPALVPPMTWQSHSTPPSPTHLKVNDGVLSWQHPSSQKQWATNILYNVYISPVYPVDISDARNLIATRLNTSSLSLQGNTEKALYVAFTAVDRYGNESAPLQMEGIYPATTSKRMLKNDGKRVRVPEKGKTLDAQYVVIESLAGNIITTKPYNGTFVDISNIPNGVYTIRTIGSKNASHRLGTMIIKR